jgi:hypothetical protein
MHFWVLFLHYRRRHNWQKSSENLGILVFRESACEDGRSAGYLPMQSLLYTVSHWCSLVTVVHHCESTPLSIRVNG